MRNEKEMLDLILDMATEDERIRAVIMNGSRANPSIPKDFFQDYDIVFLVTDVNYFVSNRSWMKRFGELMIMQTPDDMDELPQKNDGKFAYLMQFADGNRIDLVFYSAAKINEMKRDSLSVLLLEKDGIVEPFSAASEIDYVPDPPSEKQFDDCCNEFWWVCPYVAKGLWRRELTYAKYMMESPVRDMLMKMITWHIGIKTNFSISPGKLGKYCEKYLEPELWMELVKTYSDADFENIWKSLFTMCNLFRNMAIGVANYFSYRYPHGDDERVTAHLKHVKDLPKDAKEMYSDKQA